MGVMEVCVFCCTWYFAADAKGHLLIYLPSFMLVGFVGAACGYLLSILISPQNATLAACASIMILGCGLSMPSNVFQHLHDSHFILLFKSSMLFWSTSKNFFRLIDAAGGCEIIPTTLGAPDYFELTNSGWGQQQFC